MLNWFVSLPLAFRDIGLALAAVLVFLTAMALVPKLVGFVAFTVGLTIIAWILIQIIRSVFFDNGALS